MSSEKKKKLTRPHRSTEYTLPVQVNLKPEQKQKLEATAKSKGLSLSAYIRTTLLSMLELEASQ